MTQERPPWTIGRRAIADPACQLLLSEYLAEVRSRVEDFDPMRAAPPGAGDFEAPNGVFLLATIAEEPAACGALRRIADGVGELRRMYVRPTWRGIGLGRAMLVALEDQARELELNDLRLDTNEELEEALALYRASGYRDIVPYNDNQFADIWLAKHL